MEDDSECLSEQSGQKREFKDVVGQAPECRTKRALIIEDSMVSRRVMSRMLKKLGFDVAEAVNGMEGLKELQANRLLMRRVRQRTSMDLTVTPLRATAPRWPRRAI